MADPEPPEYKFETAEGAPSGGLSEGVDAMKAGDLTAAIAILEAFCRSESSGAELVEVSHIVSVTLHFAVQFCFTVTTLLASTTVDSARYSDRQRSKQEQSFVDTAAITRTVIASLHCFTATALPVRHPPVAAGVAYTWDGTRRERQRRAGDQTRDNRT